MNKLKLPQEVCFLLERLNRAGYEAYVVGGCVRDMLLGLQPHDWDITTSACPDEVMVCFSDVPLLKHGIRHGTVGILLKDKIYEVTTFRTEAGYSDHRHPDEVRFVRDLREDLARRDFTVNAMAYHPRQGLVDPFRGQSDLAAGQIVCVGEADVRFQEDALRILRALRFASCHGWQIVGTTADGLHRNRQLLTGIASERVREELMRLLSGRDAVRVLREYADVFSVILPEIQPMFGLEQCNPYHCYDVWEHTLHAVDAVRAEEPLLRLTMLLHDIGKPHCFTVDENGIGHFYGHDVKGAELSRDILRRLRLDTKTVDLLSDLVKRHGVELRPEEKSLRRWINRIGEQKLRCLLSVQRADTKAKTPNGQTERLAELSKIEQKLEEVLAAKVCCTLQELAVKGNDLIELGLAEGPQIGEILRDLLERVLEDELPNDREVLLNEIKRQRNW